MNLVTVDPFDNSLKYKLIAFQNNISTELGFIDEYEGIRKTKTKEQYNKEKLLSNDIFEVAAALTHEEVTDLCYFKGTKDNKFVEIEPISINKKVKKSFLQAVSNYAFNQLNAETITIFSNDIKESVLTDLGYESLGEYKNKNAYVKDKEDYKDMGNVVK